MNLTITHPYLQIPTAAASFLFGGFVVGKNCFIKLLSMSEYLVTKNFGDYDRPRKLNDKIVIKMNNNKCFYAQNVILAGLITIISKAAYPILVAAGCPSIVAVSALVGVVASSIIGVLLNFYQHNDNTDPCGGHYCLISNEEVLKYGINIDSVKKLKSSAKVYLHFGCAPVIRDEALEQLNSEESGKKG